MKKIIFSLIILISVSTIAYAWEDPDLSGRYQWDEAWIEVGGGGESAYCGCWDWDGDNIGNDTSLDPSTITFIKVVVNEKKVTAICKFTDESDWYGTSAQLGDIADCHLSAEEVTCSGGTGHVTAAANHGDEPGGTVIIKFTFDRDECECND